VTAALAAFERTLLVGDSPFDRYLYGGDGKALSATAVRGLELFRGRAQCAKCHLIGEHEALLTDNLYHSVGVGLRWVQPHLAQATTRIVRETPAVLDQLIGADAEVAALGRFVVTKQPRDIGSFRTPSLRNVALTAPYMHDGSTATLEEALELELYYRSVELQKPLILTPAEKADLVAFLRSLTSPTATSIQ
jgi:cytochrome c peroxidase